MAWLPAHVKLTRRVKETKSVISKGSGNALHLDVCLGRLSTIRTDFCHFFFFITYRCVLQNKNNVYAKSNRAGIPSCVEKGNVFL